MKIADVLAKLPKIAPKAEHKKAHPGAGVFAAGEADRGGFVCAGAIARCGDAAAGADDRRRRGQGECAALFRRWLDAVRGGGRRGDRRHRVSMEDGGRTLVRKYEGHKDALYALALSPDGQTLATGSYDQKIKLWKVADGAEIKTLSGHNGGVYGLSFRPDGKVLASASADRTVKLWDVATGKRLDTLSQPLKEQTAVAFAPDGKTLVAGGVDSRIRVWEVSEKAEEGSNPLLLTRFAHEGAILNLAFSADGQTARFHRGGSHGEGVEDGGRDGTALARAAAGLVAGIGVARWRLCSRSAGWMVRSPFTIPRRASRRRRRSR